MEITWYGHSCFRLSERSMASVVTDPYDPRSLGLESLKLKADILTISHDLPGHNYIQAVKGDPYIISGPGEYEVGGVFITGIQTNGHTRKKDEGPRNTLYVIEYNGINVVHLGALDRVPTQTEVEALGPVNIVFVPVGGGSSLNASKAAEVVSLLEPNVVIPMHFYLPDSSAKLDPVSKFLKEMGVSETATQPTLKVSSASSLPEETRVIILDYQRSS